MDIKEIKKLMSMARRAGVKSIDVNGLKIEFKDEIVIQKPRGPRLVAKTPVTQSDQKGSFPIPPAPPSLDEINKFIYEGPAEAV